MSVDVCQVWRETERMARKQHRCDSCYRAIAPGTRYVAVFFVHDGHAKDEKSCFDCYRDNKAFCAGELDGGDNVSVLYPSCFPGELADAAHGKPLLGEMLARLESRRPT